MDAITLLALPPNRKGRSAPTALTADSGLWAGTAGMAALAARVSEEGAKAAAVAVGCDVGDGSAGASKSAATALAAEGPGRIGAGGGLLPNRDAVPAPPCGSSPEAFCSVVTQKRKTKLAAKRPKRDASAA